MSTSEAPATEQPATIDIFGLVGLDLDNKFRIERVVAEGGFGVVYAGRHLSLDVPVAVKVLKVPAELAPEARKAFIEKFTLEAKTMARIKHPNIVQVLDTDATEMPSGGVAPWMVMEWLEGQPLDEVLHARRGKGGLSPDEAYTLLKPALEAFAYAHDEGIAHRDIKPANVMLVRSKRGTTLRVLDFGIAKLMQRDETAGSGHTATRSTFNAFSPQYAAPEQIGGSRTGPWTDVHALGLIWTEVLTDRAPYGDVDDVTALFQEILSPVRPTPSKFNVHVGALEGVLRKAVAFKPEDRFPNAGDLLAAIEAALPNARAGTAVFQALADNMTAGVVPGAQAAPPQPFQGSGQYNMPSQPAPGMPGGFGSPTGTTANYGTPATAAGGYVQGGPMGPSPTTMRGAAFSQDVDPPRVPTSSMKGPLLLGGALVLALGLVGAAVALRGTGGDADAAAASASALSAAASASAAAASASAVAASASAAALASASAASASAALPSALASATAGGDTTLLPGMGASATPSVEPTAAPTAVASAAPTARPRPTGTGRVRPPRPTANPGGGYDLE